MFSSKKACTWSERREIKDGLREISIHPGKDIFKKPELAIEALRTACRFHLRNVAESQDRGERMWSRGELGLAKKYGARIALLDSDAAKAVRNRLGKVDLMGELDEATLSLVEGHFEDVFSLRGDDDIQTDLRDVISGESEDNRGFHPIVIPSLGKVREALVNDDGKNPSDVFGVITGGTNVVSARCENVTGMEDLEIDPDSLNNSQLGAGKEVELRNWNDFWQYLFPEETLKYVRALDNDTTIAAGLALPIGVFCGENGLNDGLIVHGSDKFGPSPLIPNNAYDVGRDDVEYSKVTLQDSLRVFLCRETGITFDNIIIGYNDTIETGNAYLTHETGGENVGGLICGSGFNAEDGARNLELGHVDSSLFVNKQSIYDKIAAAMGGGSTFDLECLCCGKQIDRVFLAAANACGIERMNLSTEDLNKLMFALAYGKDLDGIHVDLPFYGEKQVLEIIASKIVGRAKEALAHALSAVYHVSGVQQFGGDGSYLEKEPQHVARVNDRIREIAGVEHDVVLAHPSPVNGIEPGKVPLSLAGMFYTAHGNNLVRRKTES